MKRKKIRKFLKNRIWKSRIAHRLKGHVDEVCRDYIAGLIDKTIPIARN